MNSLRFRQVSAGDARTLASIHALCFDEPWDEAGFARLLARAGACGLLAGDGSACHAQGFILFEQVKEEAEILTFAVRPESRRLGVGTALLEHGLAHLTGRRVGRVHLEVAEDNHAALALYRKADFTESGKRRNYYFRGPGFRAADALILCRSPDAGSGR